jgi:uncharacterized repeat protein (TIGR04076 family)
MGDEFKEYAVELEIIEVKGYCDKKHHVGQKLVVSLTETGGLCGAFYASVLKWITTFQYGGNIPYSLFAGLDKDSFDLHCPDIVNMVTARMTRSYLKTWDDAEVQRVIEEAMQQLKA